MLIYLAVPYSHPDPTVRATRFHAVSRVAAKMMTHGKFVFSPISHSHPIALAGELPTDWEYWSGYCRETLSKCGKLTVLCLMGWHVSEGVAAEIALAKELGLPITYLLPTGEPIHMFVETEEAP